MIDAETVVLGVGSPLMGDDGVGVAVVERLHAAWQPDPEVAFLDGGVWGMRIMPFIETARRLLVIDVIRNGQRPGTLIRLEKDEIPRHLHQKFSPHQIDLSEVLALAELRGTLPEEVIALGIEPAEVELHDGLSVSVEASVPKLMEEAIAQLRSWGHELSPRDVS
jgi:hydrogenase maturation protease